MLDVGHRAPDFIAEDQYGERCTLDQLVKDGPVVLYFYPRDFSFVCTQQACAFRDEHELLTFAGATVCGVNGATVESHGDFADAHNIPFPLVSDSGGDIADLYQVGSILGLVRQRVTYVIDRDKTVRGVHHHELSTRRHLDGVFDTLEGMGLPLDEARTMLARAGGAA